MPFQLVFDADAVFVLFVKVHSRVYVAEGYPADADVDIGLDQLVGGYQRFHGTGELQPGIAARFIGRSRRQLFDAAGAAWWLRFRWHGLRVYLFIGILDFPANET